MYGEVRKSVRRVLCFPVELERGLITVVVICLSFAAVASGQLLPILVHGYRFVPLSCLKVRP